jgi:SAM-dependent methyltransferase
LDVGCGTGALSAAILENCRPSSVTGVEPSQGFLLSARQHASEHARFLQGSATAIPLEDCSVDVVVSGLVLNFVPDHAAALGEMLRVIHPGGTIGAYVWDYADKMELMRYFWDAAVELDDDARRMDESTRFPICQPAKLVELFERAGLRNVQVTAIDVPTTFEDFEDYWQPFLGGQGSAPAYAMSLDESARANLRNRLRATVPVQRDGTIRLTARAWAVFGAKVGAPS